MPKNFIPLESNPTVFTELVHNLGISSSLAFADVLSLDDPDLLAFVPRPAVALILVHPTFAAYETGRKEEEAKTADYAGFGEEEDVMWFKQTINNACGLYALLHATCNGKAVQYIENRSTLQRLRDACMPLSPAERVNYLESSSEVEKAHAAAANKGDSTVPSPEEEPPGHYVCFVPSNKSGRVYKMYGNHKGPVDLGIVLREDQDMLSESVLDKVRQFIRSAGEADVGFSLMALSRVEG